MYGCNVCCWWSRHSRRALCAQAAVSAGKDYSWAVDAMGDGGGGMLFAQLLTVVDGCVAPEPTHRLTVPAVLESLTKLQRDAAAAAPAASGVGGGSSGGDSGGGASPAFVPPAALPTATASAVAPTYDVLAIIDAMESLSIDAAVMSAVANAVGTSLTATLDSLTANKVPIMKVAAVRKAVATCPPPHAATTSVRARESDALGATLTCCFVMLLDVWRHVDGTGREQCPVVLSVCGCGW